MRRIIVALAIIAAIAGISVFVAAARSAQGTGTMTAYNADVNHDGRVNILDLAVVAAYYGQAAPTQTPTTTPTATPTATPVNPANSYAGANINGTDFSTLGSLGYHVVAACWDCGYLMGKVSADPIVPQEYYILKQPTDISQLNSLGANGWRLATSFSATDYIGYVFERAVGATSPTYEYAWSTGVPPYGLYFDVAGLNTLGAQGWRIADIFNYKAGGCPCDGYRITLERRLP
ncbi:MAG: hypothetical protein ACYDEB_14030 [Dehalococcoidia bacterium]